jgi:hypothetical protein
MKAYLIEISSGSYEDYRTYIEIGYFDKKKAQEYVDEYNDKLEKDNIQSEECNNCCCGKYQYLSQVIRNCKLGTRLNNITDYNKLDGDLWLECDNKLDSYWLSEEHPARFIEIEIK